jgi:hypothetical protein
VASASNPKPGDTPMFWRTRSAPLSSTAPSTSVAAVVTTVVTTDVTEPPEPTAAVTADVTTEVAASIASTISSSRMITKWAEAKPFPEAPWPKEKVALWRADHMPVRHPGAEEIARELFAAMQAQPLCAGKWVLARCIEGLVYPAVCEELQWPMRPWLGKYGVAAAKLSPKPPRYCRVEIEGEVHNLLHYFIPHPQSATVSRIDEQRRWKA